MFVFVFTSSVLLVFSPRTFIFRYKHHKIIFVVEHVLGHRLPERLSGRKRGRVNGIKGLNDRVVQTVAV